MAYIPKQLAQSCVASTTETTVYTVPTGSSCIIKQVVLANVTGSAATTSLSIVASGGSAGDTNRVYKDLSLPANTVTTIDMSQVMASGGFISVKQGTSSAITTTVSGVEFGSAALAKDFAFATRSAGNVTVNGTSYADVDTGIDLSLAAAVGDTIEVGVAGLWGAEAVEAYLDAVTVVSASPVTYLSGNTSTGSGVLGWTGPSGTKSAIGGGVYYTLTSGDISAGTVTLRLRARTASAVNKTFTAGATSVFKWYAINHGVNAQDAIPQTLLDAKGDLIVASAADTAARLAVGANGRVLVADSAQSTGVKWAEAVPVAKARRTSGNLTLNSTSWADVDTGLDLTIPAVAGDELVASLSMGVRAAAGGLGLILDVATIVSGSPVNYFSTAGGVGDFGVMGWYREAPSAHDDPVTGSTRPYTVQSGDISGGNVTLRLRYRVSSSSWTAYAGATVPLDFWAMNLG